MAQAPNPEGNIQRRLKGVVTLDALESLSDFDEIIDVRSPAEFAEDHIPGAISCPVLDDAERAEVGTLYKQASPFIAKKLGAAYISRNIATHLQNHFLERERQWRPLIVCWRGGMRSGSMTTIFRSIGWDAHQLEGGYKAFRHLVLAELDTLPQRFTFHVLSGSTGSAKTRILRSIAEQGGQVLDLEGLAAHRGSVLGQEPQQNQPGQKWFETQMWHVLSKLSATRPVFVEAESRKIGQLRLPQALYDAMGCAKRYQIQATQEARVSFLLSDYDHFLNDATHLKTQLNPLRPLLGHENIEQLNTLIDSGNFKELTRRLLEQHYDPLYERAQERHHTGAMTVIEAQGNLDTPEIERLARSILETVPSLA